MGGLSITLASVAGTILVAALGIVTAKVSAKTQREANSDNRTDKLLASQREDFNTILAPLERRVSKAEERIGTLEGEVEREKVRSRRAINYIRELLRWARQQPGHDSAPPIPEELINEI